MEDLAAHEGRFAAKAVEGGGYTRGYGLTTLAQAFLSTLKSKGANADEMSDKDLARQYVEWNAEQLKSKFDNFDSWPDSVKVSAIDLAYNAGINAIDSYKGFSSALRSGDYEEAAKQTLDIVSANDPETGERAVLRGLANRRVDYYNKVADEVGFTPIDSLQITAKGDGSNISYVKSDSILDFDFKGKLHTASGRYDVKKKTDPFLKEKRDSLIEGLQPNTENVLVSHARDMLDPDQEIYEGVDSYHQRESEPVSAFQLAQSLAKKMTMEDTKNYLTMEEALELPDYDELLEQTSTKTVADTFFSEGAKLPKGYMEKQSILAQEELTVENIIKDREFRGLDFADDIKYQKLFEFRDRQRYGEKFIKSDPELYEISSFQPGILDTMGAAFRQYNPIMAGGRALETILKGKNPVIRKPDEGYDFYKSPLAKKLLTPEGMLYYDNSRNDEDLLQRYNRKQRDMEDLDVIQRSPSGSGLTALFAAAGPTLLAPIAPIRLMKHHSGMRRFLGGAGTGLILTGSQQTAMGTQLEARDAEEATLAMLTIMLVNGSLSAALGKNLSAQALRKTQNERMLNQQQKLSYFGKNQARKEAIAKGINPDATNSAGAAVSPELARLTAYEQIEREALEATGLNLEKLEVNPVNRLAKSPNPIVRAIAPEMVDMGGTMQKKVRANEEAMAQPVEKEMHVRYYPLLRKAGVTSDQQYSLYRSGRTVDGDIKLAFQSGKRALTDFAFGMPEGVLTARQFRERVGKAAIRGDVDRVGDSASPYVTAAAREYRKLFDAVKKEANAVGLYTTELRAELKAARELGDLERVTEIQAQIEAMRATGPMVNTATSYLPRIPRIDKIEANPQEFIRRVANYFNRTEGIPMRQARGMALEIMDAYTRRKPFLDFENATDALDFVKKPSGALRRSLDIPDRVIEDFLEKDIDAIAKYHVRTMGMDIELTRKFGEISMESTLRQISDEYESLIQATNNPTLRRELNEVMARDLDDVRALRDRLRGTYGASKDPHSMASRFVRVMKSINVITGMGGAALSSIPDMARPAMVEGLQPFMKAMGVIFAETGTMVAKMTKTELQEASVAVDAALGLRAHAMTDVGDIFGNRYGIERSLNNATGAMFFVNGLNIWNQVLKEIAGNVTILRMTSNIMARGGWDSLSQSSKEKFLKVGIGRQDYDRMRLMIEKHGQQEQTRWLPNTEAWEDSAMRIKFRIALNQNVDRIIITPGAGDRALWTSTEIGSLLTQFKSFGQGAFVRMLQSGMQERDGAFWQGAIMIVALAGIVNEIKRAQYGLPREEDPKQLLIDAIDRSGVTGFFADFNNVAEVLSGHQVGVRPLFGDDPFPSSTASVANSTLGPSGSFAVNAGSVIGDVLSGNVDEGTAKSARFMTPAGNHPMLDPILDELYGQGNVNRQDTIDRR